MEIELLQAAQRLAIALAIGLLIGMERGWRSRGVEDGARRIGLRTLAVIGLLGGSTGLLAEQFGGVFLGLVFLGLAGFLGLVHMAPHGDRGDLGLTTEFAALTAFVLAALAGLGNLALASAAAVVMSVLLSYKSALHGWLRQLEPFELAAAFKLLLLSVVMLPLLPDRGYGPWQTLNPYVIWWMVVLIAAISFVGYFAIRIAGARAGIVFTALFGGLASSTATTLNLARLGRQRELGQPLLAGGILLACGTMFPRMLLVATVIHPPLLPLLVTPAMTMAVLTYGPALWFLGRPGVTGRGDALLPNNPLELVPALVFGALLAVIMVLGEALTQWFGDAGVLGLAAASGVADVDAITLSLARMSEGDLTASVAVLGIVIAAGVNSLVKAGMALSIGGRGLGLRVVATLGLAVIAGLIATAVPYWYSP